MENAFWIERWQQKLIGFHQQEINPYLQQFWHHLSLAPGAEVLVPLCGKSRDMCWLVEQGHSVLGVELSHLASEDFFHETSQLPRLGREGAFRCYSGDAIKLLCGDFFDLERAQVEGVEAVYDRAALIALPPRMRADYARHLNELLPESVLMLLVSMEYPQEQMSGPPFAVPEAEVRNLFQSHWTVELLHREDILAAENKFRERGLTSLVEKVYLLVRRPT
jgi:thiopurine S-methyltransferase